MSRFLFAVAALVAFAAAVNQPLEARRAPLVRTIVIDPGHGGSDRGAVGNGGLEECEVTLAIALKLKALIEADPDMRRDKVRVVLTRDDDTSIQLEDRAAVANSREGDLYISIHTNAHPVRSAFGAETYILSLKASDEQAKAVAEKENYMLNGGGRERQRVESDELKLILFDVIQKKYIEESMFLAELIQTEFNSRMQLRDRGVRQAPFRVLKGVAMPAVLVEVDYISNPRQEQLLRTDAYRARIAESLLSSIVEYKKIKERGISAGGAGRSASR